MHIWECENLSTTFVFSNLPHFFLSHVCLRHECVTLVQIPIASLNQVLIRVTASPTKLATRVSVIKASRQC